MIRWRNPRSRISDSSDPSDSTFIEHTKTLFHMVGGFNVMLHQVHEKLETCPFLPSADSTTCICESKELPVELSATQLGPDEEKVFVRLAVEIDSRFPAESLFAKDQREAYLQCLDLLRRAFAGVPFDKPLMMALFWMGCAPPGLYEPLKANDTTALVLLGYWAVLLHYSRDAWDIGPTGSLLLTEICSTLFEKAKGTKDESRISELLQWPRQQVGLAPDVPEDQVGPLESVEEDAKIESRKRAYDPIRGHIVSGITMRDVPRKPTQ